MRVRQRVARVRLRQLILVICGSLITCVMSFVQVGNLSRLQCVKAAVIQQLKQLRDEHPTRKVALVTFESEVFKLFCTH